METGNEAINQQKKVYACNVCFEQVSEYTCSYLATWQNSKNYMVICVHKCNVPVHHRNGNARQLRIYTNSKVAFLCQ